MKNIIKNRNNDLENKILDIFNEFTCKHNLDILTYHSEYRIASHIDGRKSIIQKVTVNNLELLFDKIRRELKIDIDTHPTHITIYTLGKDAGIGINTKDAYKKTFEIKFK